MNNDHELLELAAKAAGYDSAIDMYGYNEIGEPLIDANDPPTVWNPLTDDGDALRLAVKLEMHVYVGTHTVVAEICSDSEEPPILEKVFVESDPYVATRRAIVRAAAEIGRNMK